MNNKLTPTEIDIQIAGTRLCDYLRDLLILSGHRLDFAGPYEQVRIQFGDAILDLVKAIRKDENK